MLCVPRNGVGIKVVSRLDVEYDQRVTAGPVAGPGLLCAADLDGGDVEPPGGGRDGVQAGPRQQQARHLQRQSHALQLRELVTANQLKTRQV